MRSGHCPKCNSSEVYVSAARKGLAGAQVGLKTGDGYPMLNFYKDKRFIPDVVLTALEIYVCQDCGYVEMYAPENDPILARLGESDNWKKMGK
ncbi:MAG TPA: hypothetical protein VHL11_08550 [Phototrophicaceae bacterium]|jgi:predicted nucleic-acid-binding Zn-ribbon protein|nr:hypothetical protein [Phototrophicaceae bacterium]